MFSRQRAGVASSGLPVVSEKLVASVVDPESSLSLTTSPRLGGVQLPLGTSETSDRSARGATGILRTPPVYTGFSSSLLPSSGALPTSALSSMSFDQLASFRRRTWAMSEALDGFGCAVTLPMDPTAAFVSSSFVGLQTAAATARPNRWRASFLRNTLLTSIMPVFTTKDPWMAGAVGGPIPAGGVAYLRCCQPSCESAVRMEVPPFAWLRADYRLTSGIAFGSVSATCSCGHSQLVCGSCWRAFDPRSRVGHVCGPPTSSGVILLAGAPELAPPCECATLLYTNAAALQQLQATTVRVGPGGKGRSVAPLREPWHDQNQGPTSHFVVPPRPQAPLKSSKRPRQPAVETALESDAAALLLTSFHGGRKHHVGAAEDEAGLEGEEGGEKPKTPGSGPNKTDIKNFIAAMGFNTMQRKALLRLALAWVERLPSSTSKRNLIAKLSIPMSATHKWGRRCKPELRVCWTIVATLFPEFVSGGRVPVVDFACISSVNQMVSPMKLPTAVRRVPTSEISSRLSCALVDAGVTETFDFSSTRNGYRLENGEYAEDDCGSE